MLVERAEHSEVQSAPALAERVTVITALLDTAARLTAGATARAIMQDVCDGLAQSSSHIRLAWIWVGPRDAARIRPAAYAGFAKGYAETLITDKNRETVLSTAYRALLKAEADPNAVRMPPLSSLVPWCEMQLRYEFREVVVLPLQLGAEQDVGMLTLYADEAEY